MKIFNTFIIVFLLIISCTKEESPNADTNIEEKSEFVVIDYDMNSLTMNQEFQLDATRGGILNHPTLTEASGLAVSRSNPSALWSHNDSGHPNRLYAVGDKGQNLGYFFITGAGSRDYEDICIGAGPENGTNYIYLADIGDNDAQYGYIVVYRIKEPDASQLDSAGVHYLNVNDIERMEFTYPDGPRDAETIMIDPTTKDLYFVSKRDYRSIVYRASYPQAIGERTELEKLAQLPFNWAVAGDISADGSQIGIKVKTKIYYWERNPQESIIDALQRQPETLPYTLEPQGESFAWTEDGSGYFTLSEQSGTPPNVYYYSKN
ncbi:hypothetical protein [Brumimicrobium mesophilum]|uniref:hypothetical protein n=1 Tax=Brumimicrobium mesophilum TaxID=392717 RepID=UPI000D13F22D|nr:hypothetical protein [Brumimicrobium mesophilum]